MNNMGRLISWLLPVIGTDFMRVQEHKSLLPKLKAFQRLASGIND